MKRPASTARFGVPGNAWLPVLLLLWLVAAASPAQELLPGAIAPATPYALVQAQAEWVAQAQALERRGDWNGLYELGRQWTRSDSRNALAWFVLGRAASGLQRHGEAIAAYREALAIAPDDVHSINNLGHAYRDSGQSAAAMRAWREALRVKPDYLDVWQNIGLTFYAHKGQAGVVKALQQLHAVDPALAEVWRKLAIDYAASRDQRVAQEAVGVLRGLSEAQRSRMFEILLAGL